MSLVIEVDVTRKDMRRLLNVGLRGMTLVTKFLLVFFLAKFLAPAEVGLYGLVVATISYSLYIVGFEFYTYTTREIVKEGKSQWAKILKGQLYFIGLMYLIFIPVLSLIFWKNILPLDLMGWFFLLLVLEHFSQEFNRVLVAMSEQVAASVVLFLRSGVWVFFVLGLMFQFPETRHLRTVFIFWSMGAALACVCSLGYLWFLGVREWTTKVDVAWVRRGILVAAPFLVSALAMRGVFTLDRYWFEHLSGLEALGVYVFFSSLTNAMISFMEAGVFVFAYPELISAHVAQDAARFRGVLQRLIKQVLIFSGLFCVSAMVLIKPLLEVLNKTQFLDRAWMFPYVLAATCFFCLSMIPQYGLYAQGKDRNIIISNVLSFVTFVVVTFVVSQWAPEHAVLLGLCAALLVGLLWISAMFLRLSPSQYIPFQAMKFRGRTDRNI